MALSPIQEVIQRLHYHKAVSGTDDLSKASDIGIDLAIKVLNQFLPKETKLFEDTKTELEVLQEMYSELRMECGEWVEIKEGCKLPDYDEYVLWAFEDGTHLWDALDKDGSPWLLNGGEVEGFPLKQATHYRKIMYQQDCQYIYDMK